MQIQKISTSQQNFGRLSGQLQRLLLKSVVENSDQACEIAKVAGKICKLTENSVVYLSRRNKPGFEFDSFAGHQLKIRPTGFLGLFMSKKVGMDLLKSKTSQPLELFKEILSRLK